MANFDLNAYETVDSRIKKFYEDHPEGRITTKLIDSRGEVGKTRWIIKAFVFRAAGYKAPDGTGYAFENDGEGMANKTSALENGETSAIGRALANIGYSGAKRPSQEEMKKATAADPVTPEPVDPFLETDWLDTINAASTLSQLQAAWDGAGKAGVTRSAVIVAAKDAKKKALS